MDNKNIYRSYLHALPRPATLYNVLAPDFIAHDLPPPSNGDSLVEFRRALGRAFPDQAFEIMDILTEGDRVAARVRLEQTHTGEFRGIPPTGKRFSVEVYEICPIKHDRIAQRWVALKPSINEVFELLRNAAP